MRISLILLFVFLGALASQSQDSSPFIPGIISYKNSQNVYVKFKSTEMISAGDTLFYSSNGEVKPLMVVTQLSSISGVCVLLEGNIVEVGDEVLFRRPLVRTTEAISSDENFEVESRDIIGSQKIVNPTPDVDEIPTRAQSIRGRMSASWYGNFYDANKDDIQKMRYVFSMNARRIGGSKFSAETYLSFRHTIGEWSEVKSNFNRSFKAYNFSILYEPDRTSSILIGRSINRNISNIGAIDGIQGQKAFGKLTTGAFLGSRPDHSDYSINLKLFQFGAYATLNSTINKQPMQNTVALVQQYNNSVTDRRFAYFQHTNSIFNRAYIFTSFEFDLYKNETGNPTSTFRMTSFYFSLRYRASRKLSLFVSYDARNNVIYYETYKSNIDRLIDEETRQGLRARVNYRPIKYLTVGVSGGYRFQTNNTSTAQNAYFYATYSQVPIIKAAMTVSTTLLKSSYLTGQVYGVRITRDIVKRKLFAEIQYRNVNYQYTTTESKLKQNVIGINMTWRIYKRLSLGLYYEGVFADFSKYNRTHINITKRF